jgi:GST-like protein
MIDLYSWTTPNGHKVHILLEETGLEYRVHPVNIRGGDQFDAEFLRISPNNKIPAIIDSDGPDGNSLSLFESGVILIYLAEKTGRFLPTEPGDRYRTLQWLMFQVGGVGPMLGQAHHFIKYAPRRIAYAVDRYTKETHRLYGVLDRQLSSTPYLAGDYSIADIATFPWVRRHPIHDVDLDDFPNVKRWFETIGERPAVGRGLQVLAEEEKAAPVDDTDAFEYLFGETQYRRR